MTTSNKITFQPHVLPREYRTPLTQAHVHDLNGDGIDEVLLSNVAFDWTGENWINSQVQVFGFNTGRFANETLMWFEPGDNFYTGGFKINFGNFNGVGFADVFLSTFTDTPNHTGPSVLLENTVTISGEVNLFNRRVIDFGRNLHSHDSVVADFDGDGIQDVLVTGSALMLGSTTGNYTTYVTPPGNVVGSVSGSGLSTADYMGDGTVTVVLTDGPGMGGSASDTLLFRPSIEDERLVMEQLAVLPADRFFLPRWDGIVDRDAQSPHAVRNIAMDFNNDGKPDVVVFSTMPKQGNVHGWTEVQFLRNDGGGSFTDVTDFVLVNFDHGKTVSYNPQLIDVNGDGLLDIFISESDYTNQPSTSVLLANADGTFIESFLEIFESFNEEMRVQTGPRAVSGQPIAFVKNSDLYYLVGGYDYEDSGIARVAVYSAPIDLSAPLIRSVRPVGDSKSIQVNANIVFEFNELIQKGTGNIEIRQGSATGTLTESFSPTSTRVTVSGSTLTIDPTNNLANSTQYFVVLPSGSVKDLAGNNYAGTSTYDFITVALPGPALIALGQAYHWKSHAVLSEVQAEVDGARMQATKALTAAETGSVISSADALAALKIAVGRNPNNDPDGDGPRAALQLSPYQLIAADVTGDGRVTAADALGILKMAVKRSDAPQRKWVFVDELKDVWAESAQAGVQGTFSVGKDSVPRAEGLVIEADPAVRPQVNLVGVLLGDVDGSWRAAAGASQLPADYLASLTSAHPNLMHPEQFGIVGV